jgi:hypothetical protein
METLRIVSATGCLLGSGGTEFLWIGFQSTPDTDYPCIIMEFGRNLSNFPGGDSLPPSRAKLELR